MAHVKVATATHAELMYLVTEVLNLPAGENPTKGELQELARASGFTAKTFEIDDDATLTLSGGAVAAPKAEFTRARIMISHEEKPGGRDAVPVSINGRAMYIPRGEPCIIRADQLEVLLNARQDYYPERERISLEQSALAIPTHVPSYPVSVLEYLP